MIKHIKLPPQEWLGYDPERGDIHGYTFEQIREFAELILFECVKIAVFKGDTETAKEIKEHFGLK